MPAHYHDEIELLNAEDVERIHRRTDELELRRDWVIVPMNCAETGMERVLPDGKVLLRAPGAAAFESWLEELHSRLAEIDLSRTARRDGEDPNVQRTGTYGPRCSGTRGYLERQPDLNGVNDNFVPRRPNEGDCSMKSIRPLHDRVVVPAEKEILAGLRT